MSNYQHGSQDISQHNETYSRVMNITVWSGGLIGLATLYSTMVFAAKMSWFNSLGVVFVVAILTGLALKRGGAWYGVVIAMTVLTAIIGFGASFLAGMA